MVNSGSRVTIAVDSRATVEAAAAGGIREVLMAAYVADFAHSRGLAVRGVMGYEGHLMMAPGETKAFRVADAISHLVRAHRDVGGDVVSGGGTGTYHLNRWVTKFRRVRSR